MNMEADVIRKVISLVDWQHMIMPGRYPAQGQFVVTGGVLGGGDEAKRIGYCVQIRKGRGQFGSDMVFLRHPDGALITHENQCYIGMTEEQERLARSIFTVLPEDEDYSNGYRCCGKIEEVGFIIENSASEPTPDQPFTIMISGSRA